MTKECAEYLNATAGRWNKEKSDKAIEKINRKRVVTEKEGRKIGDWVAQWATDNCKGVDETEVLCYTEDDEVWVAVRLYGDVGDKDQYKVMMEMKKQGLMEVETVIGLMDDGYVTIYGHGPNVPFSAKFDRAVLIVGGVALPKKCKVAIKEYRAGKTSMAMMWITSTAKPRSVAAPDVYTAEKAIRRALKGVAKIREAERIGGNKWTVAYWLYL